MADFKKYLKEKLKDKKGIVGRATFLPPDPVNVLQSSASLSVVDLLTEGPIEGLVTQDGKYADGIKYFESFYLDRTPVKQKQDVVPKIKDIPFAKITHVDRLTKDSIIKALDSIAQRLSGAPSIAVTTGAPWTRNAGTAAGQPSPNLTGAGKVLSYFNRGMFYRETDGNFGEGTSLTAAQRFQAPQIDTFIESGIFTGGTTNQNGSTLDGDDSRMICALFRPHRTSNYQFSIGSDDGSYMFLGPAIEANSRAETNMFFMSEHGTEAAGSLSSFSYTNTEGVSATFNQDAHGYSGRSVGGIMIRNGENQGTTNRYGQTGLEQGRFYPVLCFHHDGGGSDDDFKIRFRPTSTTTTSSLTNESAVDGEIYKIHTQEGAWGDFLIRKNLGANEGSGSYHGPGSVNTEGSNQNAASSSNIGNGANETSPFGRFLGATQRGTSSSTGEHLTTGAIFTLEGLNEFGLKTGSGFGQAITKPRRDEIATFRTEITDFISQNTGLSRFGIVSYDISGIYGESDLISGRLNYTGGSGRGRNDTYLTTVFEFQNYFTQGTGVASEAIPVKRQIKTESEETINIPDDIHFISPIYVTGTTGRLRNNISGRIENLRQIKGFVGGGIFFFEMGDNPTGKVRAGAENVFNTGKFFANKADPLSYDLVRGSGFDGKYDVFAFSGTATETLDGASIVLSQATQNQLTPTIGLTNGSTLKIGFISDVDARYNYSNVSSSFRHGYEQQPIMDGYESNFYDHRIEKTLIGPLIYGTGNAASGFGTGYSDIRPTGTDLGGDYSNWLVNAPLEHDAYPYTHIIKRGEVDKAYPTISINSLYDTEHAGDDAGQLKKASLGIRIEYGFEGTVGEDSPDTQAYLDELLSAGNSIQDIAKKNYKKSLTKVYTSIVQSTYMSTIDELDDLPSQKVLKGLKAEDIPGWHADLATKFNIDQTAELFPGNEWKKVNRFVRVMKLSNETNSALISRDCHLNYVTEQIKQKFSYPFSTVAGSTFDARSFSSMPAREYDIRGKRILIPSNYEPLNTDGSDKRFIANSSEYGKREIFKFKNNEFARQTRDFKLNATANYSIEGKVRYAGSDMGSYDRLFDFEIIGGQSVMALWFSDVSEPTYEIFQLRVNKATDYSAGSYNYAGIEYDEADHTAGDIYQYFLDIVGNSVRLSVYKGLKDAGGTFIGYNTTTFPRYDATIRVHLGGEQGGTQLFETSDGQIVDTIIRENNQILHWYDGTVLYSADYGWMMKDKIGGNHLDIVASSSAFFREATIDVEEDTNFEFGRNKSVLYNGDWDGTFKLGWTDNPAWILYDLMINPMYGIGNNLDDREDINIFKLFEIARYCDAVDSNGLFDGVPDSTDGLEPRFSANIRISQAKNAYEVISNIASIFRAISFWDGSALSFSIDRDKEISAIFNNGNVFDGVFNYGDVASTARFTRVEVPYADRTDQFASKFEYVEDEERIRQFGIITNKANGIGCTSQSQARRMGKYIMLSNKLETELVSFSAGIESLFLEPGDIIRINDEVKNFELNYGQIIGINTGNIKAKVAPFFLIEDQINTGNIMTGFAVGGMYTYSNANKQNELENLYDVINYDRASVFGVDTFEPGTFPTTHTGIVPLSEMQKIGNPQISRFYITGALATTSGTKLILSTGHPKDGGIQNNYSGITGVRTGSFFNLEMDNRVSGEYKVVKVSQEEENKFNIHALQYERRKYDMIEAEDFDLEENTHNIGIPKHIINRPSAPTFQFELIQNNDLSYSITGDIEPQGAATETAYRITLLKTNMSNPYRQKRVEKDLSTDADGEGTPFRINGLTNGTYTIRVNALQNPESSSSVYKTFDVKPLKLVYMNPIIKDVSINEATDAETYNFDFYRNNRTGYGNGQSPITDCVYNLNIVEEHNRDVDISILNYSLDVYAKVDNSYTKIQENYKNNQYTFTEVKNRLTYGQTNSGFDLMFKLKKGEEVVDTTYYTTTII